jgi:nitrite reductase (NADH) large subunit
MLDTLVHPAAADAPPLASRRPRGLPALDTLVVVGNGMVGHRLCRRLVELDATQRYRIVVLGEEPRPAYDRVHLTDVFAGRKTDDLALAPASWYETEGIDLVLGDPAVAIDRAARIVRSASGRVIRYGHLVLATGSSPYVPPIEGAELSRVLVYRTLRDVCAIREQARTARTAAVIGGGLLGLEAARALQHLGLAVTVVEAAAALMPTQLDQHAGKELEARIVRLGINVLTAAITKRIEADGNRRTLHVGGGERVIADMVVIAAGIRPRSELAAACGLATGRAGGVVVDDRLRTSDPNISAIGECASHRSRVYGLVAPGYAMADALAANLAGGSASFAGAAPPARLKLLDVDVASIGEPLDARGSIRFRAEGTYRVLRVERGRVVGALGIGEWPELGRIQDAIAGRVRIWPWQAERFERTGTLWRQSGDHPATDWPPGAVVCNCLSVTRGQIAAACAAGASSVASIVERTGASTLCGACRPLLVQIAGAGTPQPGRIARGLLGLSLTALMVAAAVALFEPIPFSTSVLSPSRIDVLWRNSGYREITGFLTVALTLLASALTVRKRWRRVSAGAYPAWRLGHALLGVLTLTMVGVHTGARFGDNLNFALMSSFGAVNVLGAAAGGMTAVEQRLGTPAGRRCRSALTLLHVLALWPLPVLIAFHVLSAYYF